MSTAKRGRVKKVIEKQATPSILGFLTRTEPSTKNFVSNLISEIISKAAELGEKSFYKKKHRGDSASQKQLEAWQNDFKWLEIDGEGVDTRLKCKICIKHNVPTVWARDGSCNIQRDTIVKHNKSIEHREAEKKVLSNAAITPCDESDSSNVDTVVVDDNDLRLVRTVFYAACEEIPTCKVNSLLDLQRLNGASIKYKNLSRDTVCEIQSCIKTLFQREIVSAILESDVYAIMLDESTDITVQKHLSICVRYVQNGESLTKFLGNIHIVDGKAHTIVLEVISFLQALGLDPGKIVSLATDGAAVMTGKKTGVGVQLQSKWSPFMLQVHCIAHRLNLAVCDSIKKNKTLDKFKEMFSALYHFMSNSSSRVERLKELQAVLGEPELTIKEPYSVRWLGLRNAVKAVYESYSSLLATLSSFAEVNSTAKGLFHYFSDYKTVLLVSLMLDIHECLGILSQQMQQQNICFSQIQPMIDGALGQLEYLESTDGDNLKAMKQCMEFKEEESKQVAYLDDEKLSRYSEQSESEFTSLRVEYVNRLQKNIKHRLRKNDSEMFTYLSLLLEPIVVSQSSEEEIKDSLVKVGLLYGEDKETTRMYGSLTEGIEEERTEVKKLLDKEKLNKQWPRMRGMILGSYKNYTLQNLCKRVLLMHPDLTEFVKLCKIALCFTVTSVECERSFSTQNRLKNKYRGSIKSENLDILMHIAMSKYDMSNFNPQKATQLWLSKKKRRKGRLCQDYKPRAKKACPEKVC